MRQTDTEESKGRQMTHTHAAHASLTPATTRGNRGHVRNRQRILGPLELLVIAAAIAVVLAGALYHPTHAGLGTGSTGVRVERGDTLWSIAQAHPVKGLTTAQTADIIASSNSLDGSPLATGRTLVVPAAPLSESVASRAEAAPNTP